MLNCVAFDLKSANSIAHDVVEEIPVRRRHRDPGSTCVSQTYAFLWSEARAHELHSIQLEFPMEASLDAMDCEGLVLRVIHFSTLSVVAAKSK